MDKDSEIVKLTERIARDPKSKLFVPLAEEYKKTGDLEMAVHVLTEGLQNNPGYVTARSFLGRLLLERGDLEGARKELEEVVKAIPDNLLAQRKLGDIYVLQGRRQEALQRYSAARALNAADAELASLVADLEAGKDVSTRIPKPQAPPVAAPAAAPAPSAAGTQQARTAVPAPAAVTSAGRAQSTLKPPAVAAPKQAAAPPEEAEEVDVVEVLEPLPAQDESARALRESGLDFLLEPSAQTAPPPGPVAAPAFTPSDEVIPFVGEAGAGDMGVEWTPPEAAEQDEPPAAAAPAGPDDFNTNTLAELYIAQGFYDKAIEIYDRMLADQPENRGLQQKLGQLRALAGETVPAAPEESAEARDEAEGDNGFGSGPPPLDMSPGPGEYAPPPDMEDASFLDAAVEPPQGSGVEASPDAFQPREYVPPGEEPAPEFPGVPEAFSGAGVAFEPPMAARGSSGGWREQAIVRLERWLVNIRKEKR